MSSGGKTITKPTWSTSQKLGKLAPLQGTRDCYFQQGQEKCTVFCRVFLDLSSKVFPGIKTADLRVPNGQDRKGCILKPLPSSQGQSEFERGEDSL